MFFAKARSKRALCQPKRQRGRRMSNPGKQSDKKLKPGKPETNKFKKLAGPKYMRDTLTTSPAVGKLPRTGRSS